MGVSAEHHKEILKTVAKEEGLFIRKWVLTLIVAIVVSAGGGIISVIIFGTRVDDRLRVLEAHMEKRDDRFEVLQNQINTALKVLGDHGTELQSIRDAWQRSDHNIDTLRSSIDVKTADRYFRSNAIEDFKRERELNEAKHQILQQQIDEVKRKIGMDDAR